MKVAGYYRADADRLDAEGAGYEEAAAALRLQSERKESRLAEYGGSTSTNILRRSSVTRQNPIVRLRLRKSKWQKSATATSRESKPIAVGLASHLVSSAQECPGALVGVRALVGNTLAAMSFTGAGIEHPCEELIELQIIGIWFWRG